jgi:CHAT domain-containing protein
MNERDAAVAELTEARSRLPLVLDPAFRRVLETNLRAVEALTQPSPGAAVAALTEAIEFHSTLGRRMNVPDLLLERGRAYLRAGDRERAAADFEAGVAELEKQRETLAQGEARWGIFYDAEELFDDAIGLALSNHDVARAFSYTERARARALLDALGTTWSRVTPADVPHDSIVVEYAVQEKRLIIFLVDERGIRAAQLPVDEGTLQAESAELRNAAIASDRRRLELAGRALYRRLIAPVESDLIGKNTLVFVPDPKLASVPFAALVDEQGRWLIETHALSVAPSAAVYAHLAKRETATTRGRHLLLVTGGEELGTLSAAGREGDAVAREYGSVMRLSRESASADVFLREAAKADVVHFVGHAVSSDGSRHAGYLLLEGTGSDARLDAKRIASAPLPRTSVVVLAACDTLAGEVRSTEGTDSLGRAFLAAGVPSVVATLWPIEDQQAAAFFPAVHRHMARGLSPAEALRAAQIEAIRDPALSPALWAAVQLLGR